MKHNIYFCTTMLLGLFLGACNPLYTGGGQPLAKMTFNHVRPNALYVASYEPVAFARGITNKAVLPDGFVADPAALVFEYLEKRYEASGSQGKLRITIEDVSIQYEVVQSEHKFGAMFGVDNSDHYLVRVRIKMHSYGTEEGNDKSVTLMAHRNIYVSEHSSLVDRENTQMQALDNLVDDLDVSIRKVLKDSFRLLR